MCTVAVMISTLQAPEEQKYKVRYRGIPKSKYAEEMARRAEEEEEERKKKEMVSNVSFCDETVYLGLVHCSL